MSQEIDFRKSAEAYLRFYKALTSGDTGFPEIPPEIARDIIEYVWKKCVVRRLFPWIMMDSDTVKYYVESGTISVYSPSTEGAQVTESKITFGTPVELIAKEIRAWSSITDVASEEAAIDVIARTVKHFGNKFAECEERNALTGAGDASSANDLFKGLSKLSSADGAQVTNKSKNSLGLDDINNALAYFEDAGYDTGGLVMLINPYALMHLRKALIDAGLDTFASQVTEEGEFPRLYGIRIVPTGWLVRRQYNPSASPPDTTLVSDVVITNPSVSAVGGDRRKITIERDRDITKGVTIVAASERFAWRVLKPDAVYVFQNVLSQ